MSETIRIPNIENYIQEIVNGELVLTPKHLFQKSTFEKRVDKLIKECNIQGKVFILKNIERNMNDEFMNERKRMEMYESEIAKTLDTDDKREYLKKLAYISCIKMEEIKELRTRLFGDT